MIIIMMSQTLMEYVVVYSPRTESNESSIIRSWSVVQIRRKKMKELFISVFHSLLFKSFSLSIDMEDGGICLLQFES